MLTYLSKAAPEATGTDPTFVWFTHALKAITCVKRDWRVKEPVQTRTLWLLYAIKHHTGCRVICLQPRALFPAPPSLFSHKGACG